jgi:hypothetical protein
MELQPLAKEIPADNLEPAQFKLYRVLMKLRRIRSSELSAAKYPGTFPLWQLKGPE